MMNLKSFLIGLSLGLSGKPLPISGGEPSVEPVAYLYGHVAKEGETFTNNTPKYTIAGTEYYGYILPNIYDVYTPELQAEYPYAVICNMYTFPTLILSKDKAYYGDRPEADMNGYLVIYRLPTPCDVKITIPNECHLGEQFVEGVVWRDFDDLHMDISDHLCDVLWANHEIRTTDNQVRLPYIDPIPIYE